MLLTQVGEYGTNGPKDSARIYNRRLDGLTEAKAKRNE